MNGSVSEWQIDVIKESISHCYEAMIEHLQLSYQEKEEQKHQMKQSLELYIYGVKDELRAKGRQVWGVINDNHNENWFEDSGFNRTLITRIWIR